MTASVPAQPPVPPPPWAAELARHFETLIPRPALRRVPPSDGSARPAAVLILLAEGPAGPDVLLIERAPDLRSHAGQPAFPGGATDPEDGSPVETALREATEEVGLDPASVEVLASAPRLYLPPSNFMVTPVLAWWRRPGPVAPVDPAETAAVVRVPVADLADPANRLSCVALRGWVGPAFEVRGLFVWGFTAGLLDALLRAGGWERPWNARRSVPAPVTTRGGPVGELSEAAIDEAGETL